MYRYHGWLCSHESPDKDAILKELTNINIHYPCSVEFVNGSLHISFSGGTNRDRRTLDNIINYLCSLNGKFFGCVYINDDESEDPFFFKVIKIVNDVPTHMNDNNFTASETDILFK
ncbi:MAG: Imm7 family immunity protein [Marinicella sp.]